MMSFVSRNLAALLLVLALGQKALTSHENEKVEKWLVYVQDGQTATFECPKLSSDDHVRLFIDDGFEIELSDRVSYNPTDGFEIKNFTVLDTGFYICTIEKDNETRTLREFNVQVLRAPRPLELPEIDKHKLRHVVEGDNLRVNCSVEVSRDDWVFVHWIIPQEEDDRISLERFEVTKPWRTIASEELRINNVSSIDEGKYKCRAGIIGMNRFKETTTTLTVLAKRGQVANP